MRKVLCVVVLFCLVGLLVGCGNSEETVEDVPEPTPVETPMPEDVEEPEDLEDAEEESAADRIAREIEEVEILAAYIEEVLNDIFGGSESTGITSFSVVPEPFILRMNFVVHPLITSDMFLEMFEDILTIIGQKASILFGYERPGDDDFGEIFEHVGLLLGIQPDMDILASLGAIPDSGVWVIIEFFEPGTIRPGVIQAEYMDI